MSFAWAGRDSGRNKRKATGAGGRLRTLAQHDDVRRRVLFWLPLVLLPIGCGLAAMAIGQDITSDTLLYHFYDSWAFLHGRLLNDVFPGSSQSLVNPFEDVPVFLLDVHTPPIFAAFVTGAWQGVSPALIYLIARRMTCTPWIPVVAGITSAVAGGFASELGSMMGDTTGAPFLLLGVLLTIVALQRRLAADRSWRADPRSTNEHTDRGNQRARGASSSWLWFASGGAIGVGTGLKFAEASLAIGLGVAIAVTPLRWRSKLAAGVLTLLGGLVGLASTAGYWTWFLWRHYGDPFAFTGGPFLGFHSPYFPDTAAPSTWHPPASFLQGLYYPVYWFFHPTAVIGIDIRAASLPIAYLLTVGLLVTWIAATAFRAGRRLRASSAPTAPDVSTNLERSRPESAGIDRYLVAAFVVTLVVWVKVFAVYRYLIPLELLSPLVMLAAGRRMAAQLRKLHLSVLIRTRVLTGIFALLCGLSVASASGGNFWLRIPFGPHEFSVSTPQMLKNGRLDVVVLENADWQSVGANPDGFVLPLLRAHFVAIGGIENLLTPATKGLVRAAFAKVRRVRGTIVGMWIGTPPTGSQPAYLAALGEPGLHTSSCVRETLHVGFGYEGIGFCTYRPTTRPGR